MYLTLNPSDYAGWVNEKVVKPESPNVELIHSTYADNPFLAELYTSEIEELKDTDPDYYRIYGLGLWGQLRNIVYPVWDLVDDMPRPADCEWERYGVDFGYENPAAIVHVACTGRDLYWDEILFQSHLTTPDLINALKDERRLNIYADSSEPDRIMEMEHAGLAAHPSIRNVSLRLDSVKRYRLHITKRSVNLQKEIKGYHKKTDKAGNVLEEPVKFADHGMDAGGYGTVGPKLEEEVTENVIIFDSMEMVTDMDL